MSGSHEGWMGEDDARAMPGVEAQDFHHPDGTRELRLIRREGDDALAYDFERGAWERLSGLGGHSFALEDRWRKRWRPS